MTGTNQGMGSHPDAQLTKTNKNPLLVAEGLHVLNQEVYSAVTQRSADKLLALARRHLATGVQALAVNLGPGKTMAGLTAWVAQTLLEQLRIPLFFSANILAHPTILQSYGPQLTITR